MKRILSYILILMAVLMAPAKGTDIGKLLPVELVIIYRENAEVVIETDTQDAGRGKTVSEAIENLKATTAGIVYLDTADYLLVDLSAAETVRELSAYLKSEVEMCQAEPGIDLEEAADYLTVHPPEVKLKDYQNAAQLKKLTPENGRLILE